MSTKSLSSFRGRVRLGLWVVAAYLLLLLGVSLSGQWRSAERLGTETLRRARSAAADLLSASEDTLLASLRDWERGGAPRRPGIPRDLELRHGVVSAELLSPAGWTIDARSGLEPATGPSPLTEAEARRLAAGVAIADESGLAGAPEYAVVAVLQPVLGSDGRLAGILRVEVEAEQLALARRQLAWAACIEGGSILAFVALLALFARWAVRPLDLLEAARRSPEGPGEALARADDTGFVIETYRRVIDQLREKETELRRLRELERHRADELQELNASIVDSMLSGVIVLDLSGSVRTMNDVARDVLQVPRDERVTGRHHADVLRAAPEIGARLTACLERGEARARDEVRLSLPGLGRRDVGIAVSPLRGTDGAQRGALAVVVDLTEVKRLQEEVRLKESMAELGELSAGVAHEFRNSLATILGFARLVEKETSGDPKDNAAAIAAECASLRRVVDDFLRFANPARLVIETVDLAAMLESLAEDVARRAGEKRVTYEVVPGLPVVSGDETLLRRTFTNLVRNACDAVPDGGRIRIAWETAPREIVVHVDDDGPGIPADERQRVFIPFFTRKEHGTGLGLALARKVVVHHGGRISVDDSPLGGARVSVALPLRTADGTRASGPAATGAT